MDPLFGGVAVVALTGFQTTGTATPPATSTAGRTSVLNEDTDPQER